MRVAQKAELSFNFFIETATHQSGVKSGKKDPRIVWQTGQKHFEKTFNEILNDGPQDEPVAKLQSS